jgi:glutamyl-Q tRNA(Asp) synthetase
MTPPGGYRGRFAPSPTGPLHFGSLVAAVASFADARKQSGQWLVRIEDVDETRCKPAADRQILEALQAFGMSWDEAPVSQSRRKDLYHEALQRLIERDAAYRCSCSRKRIAETARHGSEGPVYPGTCRSIVPPADDPAAWRVKVDGPGIQFTDRILGDIAQDLQADVGDFIVRRIDGFTAYQLAVVVDDQAQRISDVVRGADLLSSTPRQIRLQQLLGYAVPRYAHIPLVFGPDGRKLSKRDSAHPVDPASPMPALRAAWRHLGQASPPRDIEHPDTFWTWAIPHWEMQRVPNDRKHRDERADAL